MPIQQKQPEKPVEEHIVKHVGMPIHAPVVTYNFNDLIKYFKYNMGAGLIMTTLERMIQDDRMDRMSNHFGTFIKAIGVGIMLFLIFLGAYILINGMNAQKPAAAPAAISGAPLHALLFVLWRKRDDLPKLQ